MTKDRDRLKSILFVCASFVLSACAQLFMKAGMLDLHGLVSFEFSALLPSLLWVAGGLCSYAFSMLFWMAALARYELSLAYPMLSLSYVLVYIGAVQWARLGEHVSLLKTVGILLIVLGVLLVTRSAGGSKNPQAGPSGRGGE